jgi:hypothetical protein
MLALLTVSLLIVWRLRSLGLQLSLAPGGVIGLVLVLLLTASAHFFSPEALAAMLPPFVPARLPLVYVTGVLELALALGLALSPDASPGRLGDDRYARPVPPGQRLRRLRPCRDGRPRLGPGISLDPRAAAGAAHRLDLVVRGAAGRPSPLVHTVGQALRA